MGSGIFAILG